MYKIEDIINKVHNADCLEFMKQMPDKCVDLVLTDPPYGINYDKMQNKQADIGRISNGGKWKKYNYDGWDKEIPTSHYFKELFRVSKNQIIWGGNYFFLPSKCQWLVWNKIQRGYMTDGEMAWTNTQGSMKIYDLCRADAYINKTDCEKSHPTQKPIQLFKWCLSLYPHANLILDPFLGSGTTAVAAKELNRNFIGIEVSKEYCDIANERLRILDMQPRLL